MQSFCLRFLLGKIATRLIFKIMLKSLHNGPGFCLMDQLVSVSLPPSSVTGSPSSGLEASASAWQSPSVVVVPTGVSTIALLSSQELSSWKNDLYYFNCIISMAFIWRHSIHVIIWIINLDLRNQGIRISLYSGGLNNEHILIRSSNVK